MNFIFRNRYCNINDNYSESLGNPYEIPIKSINIPLNPSGRYCIQIESISKDDDWLISKKKSLDTKDEGLNLPLHSSPKLGTPLEVANFSSESPISLE